MRRDGKENREKETENKEKEENTSSQLPCEMPLGILVDDKAEKVCYEILDCNVVMV
ncbi:MAG: hypothetical protein WA667_23855 [Candidatus Nitrosopolaris sp.]